MHERPLTRGADPAGQAQALPLVRLTLALRDAAEFEAAYTDRLERDGLFVTTLRTRTAGERVRLRVELVSGGTAWSGEVVVTGAGREGGRTGFWVRLPTAADPPPRPAVTPPPLPGATALRAAPTPAPARAPVEEAEPLADEASFADLWTVGQGPAPTPAPAPAPLPARATPPPLPFRRTSPSRPDLSTIFVEEEDDDTLPPPDPGALDALQVPALMAARAADDQEEWVEGGLASMELPPEDEVLEGLY